MDWSPSMIQKRNVFEKVGKESSGYILFSIKNNGIGFGRLKKSPEEIHLLYYATKKFYKLVEV